MPEPEIAKAVGGAVSALAKPIEKLIEVASAGLGRLYEPTNIRRTSNAEAKAMRLMAAAFEDVADLHHRAAVRRQTEDERRLQSIEGVLAKVPGLLPLQVSSDPVDPDWIARFFREAQDVSNDDMQTLLAKLLAGEIAQPGRFSVRTLSIVSVLSPREAHLFNELCLSSILHNDEWIYVDPRYKSVLGGSQFNSNDLGMLNDAGLVRLGGYGGQAETGDVFSTRDGRAFRLTLPPATGTASSHPFPLGPLAFTASGQQLCPLAKGTALTPYLEMDLLPLFRRQGCTIEQGTRIVGGSFLAEGH